MPCHRVPDHANDQQIVACEETNLGRPSDLRRMGPSRRTIDIPHLWVEGRPWKCGGTGPGGPGRTLVSSECCTDRFVPPLQLTPYIVLSLTGSARRTLLPSFTTLH